jgi:hypothetical protein
MRSKITVIGAPGVVDTLMEGDIADVVGDEGLPGSDVVVIGAGADVAQAARRAASRAPGAALIVVGGDVRAALEASQRALDGVGSERQSAPRSRRASCRAGASSASPATACARPSRRSCSTAARRSTSRWSAWTTAS